MENKLVITVILLMIFPSTMLSSNQVHAYSDEELFECVDTLQSAELEIKLVDLYDSCAELLTTGKSFIHEFRDRGLLIIWANVGDTIHIPLSNNMVTVTKNF